MGAQVVSERDVLTVGPMASANVEVMRVAVGWSAKSFAARDAQFTAVLVSDRGQSQDDARQISRGS